MVKITSSLIPKGRKNRPGYSNPKLFVTVHETGNPSKGAGAKNHASYVKSDGAANAPVSWHYTCDDISIYQHLPENETGFHAGDGQGDGNRKSIGVEICVNSDGNFLKAVDNATELVADICKRNNIPITNIKQHYDWSKKNCPQNIRSGKPYDWKTFIYKVQKLLQSGENTGNGVGENPVSPTGEMYRVRKAWNNSDTQEGAYNVLDNAKAHVDRLNAKPEYFVFDSKGNKIYPK